MKDYGDKNDLKENECAQQSKKSLISSTLLLMEDFGGDFSLPWFTHSVPNLDYYSSNLNIHDFIVSNMTEDHNSVFVYDERGMGKDANAMCSLRLRYHIQLLMKARVENRLNNSYKSLIVVMDNCVGQNKSQVVFNFFCC